MGRSRTTTPLPSVLPRSNRDRTHCARSISLNPRRFRTRPTSFSSWKDGASFKPHERALRMGRGRTRSARPRPLAQTSSSAPDPKRPRSPFFWCVFVSMPTKSLQRRSLMKLHEPPTKPPTKPAANAANEGRGERLMACSCVVPSADRCLFSSSKEGRG